MEPKSNKTTPMDSNNFKIRGAYLKPNKLPSIDWQSPHIKLLSNKSQRGSVIHALIFFPHVDISNKRSLDKILVPNKMLFDVTNTQ